MTSHIIQIERVIGNDSMANIYDLSHCHKNVVERIVKQYGSNIYKLEGKEHYVIVIDTFCEFTRSESIGIVAKWLKGEYYSYDFDKEKWVMKND